MLFEGAYCYYLKLQTGVAYERWSGLRANPCHRNTWRIRIRTSWRPAGCTARGPQRRRAMRIRPSPTFRAPPILGYGLQFTGPSDILQFATIEMQLESSSDFVVRRFHFDITQDAGVTGGSSLGANPCGLGARVQRTTIWTWPLHRRGTLRA